MKMYCSVFGCLNNSKANPGISFHRLPKGLLQLPPLAENNSKKRTRKQSGPKLKAGSSRVLWGLHEDTPVAVAVGLGPRNCGFNDVEGWDEGLENIRTAAGVGVKALTPLEPKRIEVDPMSSPRAAAEGAQLASFCFQEYKSNNKKKPTPVIEPMNYDQWTELAKESWQEGDTAARCQNWARALMERPGNLLTPEIMAQEAHKVLAPLGVQVITRDAKWAQDQRMGCFLSVARGSAQPPVFLEMHYNGGAKGDAPVVLVGKGVTFDTGGISLKPSGKMAAMRGDMGGCAVVTASIFAAASMAIPLNIVGLVPLTENMPGGKATKPGDIFVARNGKSVEVDNTDAEGRLILADALSYADDFKPRATICMATLTGAMSVALGDAAVGLFSRDNALSKAIIASSYIPGERIWRMPLYKRFTETMTCYDHVDVHNVGKLTAGGGSSKAAGFLHEFRPTSGEWAHLDIASVMSGDGGHKYLGEGMSGRPTRTIIEFLKNYKV